MTGRTRTDNNTVPNELPRLWIAADVSGRDEFDRLAADMTAAGCGIKIGLEAYTAFGNGLVTSVVKNGGRVFLDLKFHDIPNTVEKACANVAVLGASLTNVHALGGPKMIAGARKSLEAAGANRPLLLAVTILTSHSAEEVRTVGLNGTPEELVPRLAKMSMDAGADGVVCSPQEAAAVRKATRPDFLIVTPGVRPAGADLNDQQRIATPTDAIKNGATHLVVGRPVTGANDRRAAALNILAEIRSALGN